MFLWLVIALVFRWRFQFSIRSLLILMLAVAIACSWMTVEMKAARKQNSAVEALRTLQIQRLYYVEMAVGYDYELDAAGDPLPNPQPPGPRWLRSLLGDGFLEEVVSLNLEYRRITDAELEETLKGMTQLRFLNLRIRGLTDQEVNHLNLSRLNQLQTLLVDYTQITDATLEHLKGLSQLQELWLDGTKITDTGLQSLKGLKRLKRLFLYNGTKITDGWVYTS